MFFFCFFQYLFCLESEDECGEVSGVATLQEEEVIVGLRFNNPIKGSSIV